MDFVASGATGNTKVVTQDKDGVPLAPLLHPRRDVQCPTNTGGVIIDRSKGPLHDSGTPLAQQDKPPTGLPLASPAWALAAIVPLTAAARKRLLARLEQAVRNRDHQELVEAVTQAQEAGISSRSGCKRSGELYAQARISLDCLAGRSAREQLAADY